MILFYYQEVALQKLAEDLSQAKDNDDLANRISQWINDADTSEPDIEDLYRGDVCHIISGPMCNLQNTSVSMIASLQCNAVHLLTKYTPVYFFKVLAQYTGVEGFSLHQYRNYNYAVLVYIIMDIQ